MPILPLSMQLGYQPNRPNLPRPNQPNLYPPTRNLPPIRPPSMSTTGYSPNAGRPNTSSFFTGREFGAPREAPQQIREMGGQPSGQLFQNYNPTPTSFPSLPPQGSQDTDYNDLMNYYRSLLSRSGNVHQPSAPQEYVPETTSFNESFSPMNPALQQYTDDPEFAEALKRLGMLAETGGYSEGDINNLRARAVSPIRSIYANAMQELQRQRSLQGGYSPNFTAATEKMARTESDRIGNQLTNVNADLAERIAAGKRQLAPIYTSEASKRLEAKNNIAGANASATNRASEFNRMQQAAINERRAANDAANAAARNRATEMNLAGRRDYENQLAGNQERGMDTQMRLLDAMRQLYGTTPARAALSGQQNIQNQEQSRLWQQLNQQGGQTLIDSYLRARGGR